MKDYSSTELFNIPHPLILLKRTANLTNYCQIIVSNYVQGFINLLL